MGKKLKTAIIGSGVAGIATSIRLSLKGHDVTVYEANEYPGGKLTQIASKGYRFDAGPSLFTLPKLVDELFELAGEDPKSHFNYQKLETNCHYFFEDGTFIRAYGEPEKFIDELNIKTGEPKSSVEKYLNRSALLYNRLSELFMFSSLNDPQIYFSKNALKAYLNIPKLGFFKTMNGANEDMFDNPKIVQLFNRYATFNGSDPYQTPATMNIIPHLEMSIGAYYPIHGMHAITQSLVGLAERTGVKFQYKSKVERIVLEKNTAAGIQVNGEFIPADRVVSNMDIVNAYKKLLPDIKSPRFLLNQPKSSSALIFYWGIKSTFPKLDLHNIFFSDDYKKEFEHIFKKGTIYHDPTIYVNITSKLTKSDAPEGCENWFTMINVPNNQGQEWPLLIAEARTNIVSKLSRMLDVNIEALIESEDILDPRTIESRTSSALGALYGNSSNNLFSAFLRHSNKSKRIKNLYFCGGSVHPGGGIPMCLSSAKIIDRYFE